MKFPALFLDRDGVINKMVAYQGNEPFDSPRTPNDVVLNKEIIPVIFWANERHILVVEVTNQPGVAKGKMSQETSDSIESKVQDLLVKSGARVDRVYTCPHHPKSVIDKLKLDCNCRKPNPGLLLQAANDLNIDLSKSVVLGDSNVDVEAAKKVGCKTILYLHPNNIPTKVRQAKQAIADYKITSLIQATPILEKLFSLFF